MRDKESVQGQGRKRNLIFVMPYSHIFLDASASEVDYYFLGFGKKISAREPKEKYRR
jgi:hypothetical protein